MKYAVIRTGGKQYRVSEGDLVKVEKLAGAVGDTVTLADVLFIGWQRRGQDWLAAGIQCEGYRRDCQSGSSKEGTGLQEEKT